MKNFRRNKIIFLLLILMRCPVLLMGSGYSLIKSNIGGNGSNIFSNLTHILHSFGQGATIDVSKDVSGRTVKHSGYLTGSGNPVNIVNISPAPALLKTSPHEKIRIEFDAELDTSTVKNAVSLTAIRNNLSKKISQNIKLSYNFYNQNSGIEIVPNYPLQYNHRYKVQIQTTVAEIWGEPLGAPVDSWFHTQINPGDDNIYAPEFNDDLKINIIAGTIDSKDKFYLKISTDLHNTPILTTMEDVARANSKLEIIDVLDYYEIRGFTAHNDTIIKDVTRGKEISVELPVSKRYSVRKSPAASPKRASRLRLYMLNEEKKLWVKVPGGNFSEDTNLYKSKIGKFGTLALMEVPTYELKDAFAYPVPFTPNSNPAHKDITFTNLATKCTIKVFTVNGELVWEYEKNDIAGDFSWDVKNKDGKNVASGVYIYYITSRDDSKMGKLMIIR
ncbi:MAG: hypothetical protein DDT19_02332 [Syntrophomonadaceae bacterium]|nr:hypothetical protein [Bacillota bacterium]